MNNFIFIAGINRSGGSLLARLLDGHKKIASYPMEVGFQFKKDIYGFVDKITGTPTYISEFNKNLDPIQYFDAEKEEVVYEWGKERSEKFGVRKNYLEKAFYESSVKTNFDHELYIKKLKEYCAQAENNLQLYSSKHRAYFDAWDKGIYAGEANYVVTHDSNGLFLNNFDKYFEDFKNSIVFVPIRDCLGYVAAEKTRVARRFFGSKRFSKPLPPNLLVKYFDEFDLDSVIRTWGISLSRIKILQEKFRHNPNFIVYRFENLAANTEEIMNFFCEKLRINKEKILYNPTLCGKPWLGNSQQGKNIGINRYPNDYAYKILRKKEIEKINSSVGKISEVLQDIKTAPVNLTTLDDKFFFDIINQRKYSNNNDTWSLYCSLGFAGFRKLKLKKVSFISVLGFIFSYFVQLCHYPRLLRQKFFPDKGKQNYT